MVDVLRQQVITLTEELTTVKTELVNMKAAHANLHQQSSDANTATARSFAEQRTRVDALETQVNQRGGTSDKERKPLIKPEQVEVKEFCGSMTDGRSKFLEWSERLCDRVELFEEGLVKAMAEAERRDGEVTVDESLKLGGKPTREPPAPRLPEEQNSGHCSSRHKRERWRSWIGIMAQAVRPIQPPDHPGCIAISAAGNTPQGSKETLRSPGVVG